MKISLTKLGLLVVLFAIVLFGDKVVAHFKFRAICEEYAHTVVYEQVYLPDDYFMPAGTEPATTRYWNFEGLGYLLSEKLELDYPEKHSRVLIVSDWGPIIRMERSYVRRLDDEVMSETVRFTNNKGWFERLFSFGNSVDRCIADYDGKLLYGSNDVSMELTSRTFCRSDGRCLHAPSGSTKSQ